MSLVENWKIILTKAWSVKLGAIASIILSLSETLPLLPIDPELAKSASETLRYLSYFVAASGMFLARILDQGIASSLIQKEIV